METILAYFHMLLNLDKKITIAIKSLNYITKRISISLNLTSVLVISGGA